MKVVLTIGLIIGGVASVAQAAPNVPELVAEAEIAYRQGRYDDAVTRYLEAYDASHDPKVLLIVAHIHDRTLKNPGMAAAYYRLYLVGDPPDKTQVEAELAAVEVRTRRKTVLRVTSPPEDQLTVRLDGREPVEGDVVKAPGPVALTIEKKGARSQTVAMNLEPGSNQLHVVWPASKPLPLEPSDSKTGHTVSWALTGVAIGAAASWGTAAVMAQVEQDHQIAVTADILLGVAAVSTVSAIIAWVAQ